MLVRLVRSLKGYWFVVLLSWIVCSIIDGLVFKTHQFAQSKVLGLWNMFLEFFGLSNFFGGTILDGTWWYMSAAIFFILLSPLLFTMLKKFGSFVFIALVIIIIRLRGNYPGGVSAYSFLLPFCFGAVFAKDNLFFWWHNFGINFNVGKAVKIEILIANFLFSVCILIFAYKLYYRLPENKWWDIKFGFIPLAVIIFANEYIINIPILKQILCFLGRHSANIFLTHTFIRHYYYSKLTYGMGHFVLIILFLLCSSLVLSIVIEFLKRITRYDSIMLKLENKLSKIEIAKKRQY